MQQVLFEKYQNIFYTLLSGGVYLDENQAVPVCSLAALLCGDLSSP